MKLLFKTLASALVGSMLVHAQLDCAFTELDPPLTIPLGDPIVPVEFVDMDPVVTLRATSDTPMIKIVRYQNHRPTYETIDGRKTVHPDNCVIGVDSGPTAAPTASPVDQGTSHANNHCGFSMLTPAVGVAVTSLLTGASPMFAAGAGFLTGMAATLPGSDAQVICENIVEIEVYTPVASNEDVEVLENKITELEGIIANLTAQLDVSFTSEDVDVVVRDALAEQIGFDDFSSITPVVDQTLARVSNGGSDSGRYNVAGFQIYSEHSPEADFFLNTIAADTRVPEMQGDVFKFPESDNEPSEVAFDLPAPPAYTGPTDLYYMPILEMASLIESGTVSCVEVIRAFIDRLTEFDPYLGIVATPLYDTALTTAASHDALLANGTYVSPLMCIPFGVKDHHQIYDDDPTMYGSILFAGNTQSVKSSMMASLLAAGAIPIAKMQLGTFAWSSANGWGECMSPYLNGPGCGSSCGSGSGAALGALPFAVSEETSGSIACPASANLISGHIGSYGSFSRTGAGLLCAETDHLGFHSRFLSDYGVIFNYARTGDDPADGDSVAFDFVNPADVDVTQMRVMIVEGEGAWEYDTEDERWRWNNVVRQSYSKTAWHWPERVAKIKAALDAAGVPYDSFTSDAAGQLWSFNESSTYFDCASPSIDVMMAGGPWAQLQECEFCFQNSKWKTFYPSNVPKYIYRYMSHCMKEMGKMFLNDDVWATYDVIIGTHSSTGGDYPLPGGSFEQWVRTAKTFVMDYYEPLPCATAQGDTVEGAFTVLTAKPFEDYKNFAIGTIIQNTTEIIFPDDDAIKTAFEGRSRCPFSYYGGYNNMTETCPPLNGPGAPPGPTLRGMDGACEPGNSRQHLPEEWANEPYVAPYEMDDPVPDRAIWRWDEYAPVACSAVCPFVPAFCKLKSITCDSRRLEEEKAANMPEANHAGLTEHDVRRLKEQFHEELSHGGEL